MRFFSIMQKNTYTFYSIAQKSGFENSKIAEKQRFFINICCYYRESRNTAPASKALGITPYKPVT